MQNLLNEAEAAKLLGISKKTMGQWRWRGCGPRYHKLGRLIRYREEDLNEFIEQCGNKRGGAR